ncbi:MAG: LCP family protein [Anaerolineae bacterium]|jgi:LCP family protein required for cell wall assembly
MNENKEIELKYRLGKTIIVAWLLATLLLPSVLTACQVTPTPTTIAAATTVRPSPTASPTATWTALPTVLAAAPRTSTPTQTATAAATSTGTVTPTYTPSSTVTPSATATATRTSTPRPAGPTITPTETLSPTVTPTLTPTPMFSPTPLPTATFSDKVMHILFIGLDSRHNLGGQNTDVIIVAAVNKDTKQVSMLSIPRDLWVYIPTHGWNRINVAHKFGHRGDHPGGGPGLLMDTIEMNFGIPIDHWVRVDFEGFGRVVDELGGVEMTVPCPVNLTYKPSYSEEEEDLILEPGVYQMDGQTALRYVRTRREGTDFDRARRQHQFLKAVWKQTKAQLKGLDFVPNIRNLWSALRDSYETDLDLLDVLSLAPTALELEPQRIRSRYIGYSQTTGWTNADGWSVLLPDYEKIQQLVASLYAPPSPGDEQVAKEGARVQVRNGTYQQQLALIAADQLRWYGVNVIGAAPADRPDYQETQIIVYNDKPQALDLLIRELEVKAENVIRQPDPNQEADIVVILGRDYDPCR